MRHRAAALLLAAVPLAAAAADCRPDPLGGRGLYLRGSFNGWNALEPMRFAWACERWVLVARITGEHRFKIGDEGWSEDADFGADPARPGRLAIKGREIERRFTGLTRLTFDPQGQAQLTIENCPPDAAPLGATRLYLRGTMNNWAAIDDYAFRFSCDAYYLNVALSGRHEFKIADAAGTQEFGLGEGSGAYLKAGGANLAREFSGEQTLRLAWAGGRPELSIGPKTFADTKEATVNDPVARSIGFDSRDASHKEPFGAVAAGTPVRFTVGAAPGIASLTLVVERRLLEGNQEKLEYHEVARAPMQRSRSGGHERWTAEHRFGEIGVFGYWFEAEVGGRRFAYQNNRDAVHWTREKGTGGRGEVGELPAARSVIRRFRQTVYAKDFQVPDWAPDLVYYYVFPDRFRNGDRSNDPRPGRDRYQNHGVELHANWNERPYRPGSGDGSDAVHNNDFFGGDLAGLTDKLDTIRELGANAIYMTPVFKAASNHKYDTADYKQIDPAFGTKADFERLCREAAERGMRVIPDTSLNHVGSDSIYFDRFGTHGSKGAFAGGRIKADSPFAGWFVFDPAQPDPDKQYKGWVGIGDLPELNKASPEFRRFAYGDADSVMKLWLDRGAAGWRMDVAPWVPDDFWREWRAAIRSHKADALTVAETWFDSSKYLLGDMFDSTMNYIFRNAVLDYAAGGTARDLAAQLEHLREAYPPQAHGALMNLLSTHDQPRSLHVLGWHEGGSDPAAIALAKQRYRLAVFFQMTYPGSPAVYYGDEVGVTGGEDPYNRAPYPWADLGGKPDLEMLAHFKRLIALRHRHAVLRRGALAAPLHADDQVLVQLRRLGDDWALIAANSSGLAREVTVSLPDAAPTRWRDALGAGRVGAAGGRIAIGLRALGGVVLIGGPAVVLMD